MNVRTGFVCAGLATALSCPSAAVANFIVFSAGGDDTPASIQATVDSFRAALGNPVNGNNPGPLAGGRREINWDGGNATTASPAANPFAGFQNTRGALFTTAGTAFLQTPLDAPELDAINPTYEEIFSFFSPVRIFTAIGSNVLDATFTIPGHPSDAATVSGFGAVFTDVDLANGASLTFFDVNDNPIFSQFVAPGTVPDGSLSFLGAIADAGERIARVRVMQGTTAPGPDDAPQALVDIVALDDFLYAEPVAQVDEPSLLALLGAAWIALLAGRAARRRTAR